MIRVYPPLRSLKPGAMSLKRILAASSWCKRATARRRSWMVPLLPSVTIFSATERAALALARVVVMRRRWIRLQTMLASIALRCSWVRPSLAVFFRCRINTAFLFRQRQRLFLRHLEQFRVEVHAQAQAQGGEFLLDFVE